MISILNYDMGNLRSVSKALEEVGANCTITRDPEQVAKSDKLVVPGVGAFKDCIENLKSFGLLDAIQSFVKSGKPYLGICLGMQLLMSESEEGGIYPGLNLIKGRVVRFPHELNLKVPHMGWNTLKVNPESQLLNKLPKDPYVYFVHSYYVVPEKPKKVTAATTDYGMEFVSSIEHDNIFGTQFHPEKSQKIGLSILKRFVEM